MTRDIFNIMIVGQGGRLQFEAILLVASLRHSCPNFKGKVIVAEPQPNHRWDNDPRMSAEPRAVLEKMGAEIRPFENQVFGCGYPYGNKIEALQTLPEGEPFLFLDTDTLITGDLTKVPFNFDRPTASMKREGTWPQIELYGPNYSDIWGALYDRFDLDFEASLDRSQPDEYWQRYLYFNAGFFYYRCPKIFGERFLKFAQSIRDDPPKELACQELKPWLDQIALPLVIHSLGGGRLPEISNALDHEVTCHYRVLSLLYARESDETVQLLEDIVQPNWLKKVIKIYDPLRKLVLQKKGHKVREMFDRNDLPRREQAIRNQIKRANLWMR